MPVIRASLKAVRPQFSQAEIAFVKCILLVANRLKRNLGLESLKELVLPEEIWVKVLSFSQKVYIQSQTVKAESFQGSDADMKQIASYNKYNLVWKSLGAEPIGPCGGSPSYFRRG